MIQISIVMPAYNEEKNIENIVKQCYGVLKKYRLNGEIIVTDDGSKDKTRVILDNLKKEIPYLRVILHKINKGYGESVADGIKASKGYYIVTLDSDGQFDINELSLLLDKIKKGYDIVTGFRKKKKDAISKVIANKILIKIIRYLFKIKLKDTNCAFKIYKKDLFEKISIEASNFILPSEILIKANALSYKIAEIGITHLPRKKGKSSIKIFKNSFDIFSFLLYLKKKIILYKKGIIRSL